MQLCMYMQCHKQAPWGAAGRSSQLTVGDAVLDMQKSWSNHFPRECLAKIVSSGCSRCRKKLTSLRHSLVGGCRKGIHSSAVSII